MAVVKMYTYHPRYPELRVTHGRFEWTPFWRSLAEVWPALLGPLVIIGGIRRDLHRDRGGGRGLPLRVRRRLFLVSQDPLRDFEGHLRRRGDHHHHGVRRDRGLRCDGMASRLYAVQRHGGGVGDERLEEPVRGAAGLRGGDDHPGHVRRFAWRSCSCSRRSQWNSASATASTRFKWAWSW